MAEDQAAEIQATPGRDVFISYASQDKAVAESVCKALEGAGLACWIAPRDVVPGESFAGAIVHAIDATKVIVLVLSEHAADSQHVLREVERAASKRHAVIAFRLDVKPLPADFEYFLNTSQWLDASTTGVRRALPKLVEAVRGATAQAPAGSGDIPAGTVATAVSQRWRPALIGSVALVLAIGAYALINRFLFSKPLTTSSLATSVERAPKVSVPEVSEKSIAVLPFVDMSEKHDQEYFSDGLSEELIDHLAHASDLKVIGRTSSFAFKGKNEDMRVIAAKLGVANLLEGSVRKAGVELRITAQLVRASDGVHLWSQTYARKLQDIFKVQEEVAGTVAQSLQVALDEHPGTHGGREPNIEAYNLLLKGNFFSVRNTSGDDERAIEQYKAAIAVDPTYSRAWIQLGGMYSWQGRIGERPVADAAVKAREALKKALAIDPRSARAHLGLGYISQLLDWDWATAKLEYERARDLDTSADINRDVAEALVFLQAMQTGNLAEIIVISEQDAARNPLDTDALFGLGWLYRNAGRPAEAAAAYRRLLDLNPAYLRGHAVYGLALLAMGKTAEALTAADKESDEEARLWTLARIYWAMGRRSESDDALHQLEARYADLYPYDIAQVHAYRRDAEGAFRWLDRAHNQRDSLITSLKFDSVLRSLRGDPRYKALLRKMNLPVT